MFEKEAHEQANKKYSIPLNWNEIDVTRRSKYEEGFKDGAEFGYNKANEWHDLRKNSNDLPKDKRYVWCDYGEDCNKGFYDGGWWIDGHIYCSIIEAWCEIPIFNKE